MKPWRLLFIAAFLPACAAPSDDVDAADDSFLDLGAADAFGVSEGSPQACAVLRLVNEASFDELRGVANPASMHIDFYRMGPDMARGTSDDQQIDTLAELDAIPYVGASSFAKLLNYALVHFPCGALPNPATATSCMVLRAANEATRDQLDFDAALDARAADAIVAARPLGSPEALDAVPYVGAKAIDLLGRYAIAKNLTCADTCNGIGGTFDGVTFTRAQECHAVDFMNRARLSQMATLNATPRHYIYDCAPSAGSLDCSSGRKRAWTRLSQLDPFVGGTSMSQLSAAAAAWVDDGVRADTVAATWNERQTLIEAPVGFDNVFVVRRTNPGTTTKFCYEIRDTPTAPNYLRACVYVGSSDSPAPCSTATCLDTWIGRNVALRGRLTTDSSGYVVNVAASVAPQLPRQ